MPKKSKIDRRRRMSIIEAASSYMLRLDQEQIERADVNGNGNAITAIREGCRLPEGSLRLTRAQHCTALQDVLHAAGIPSDGKGARHMLEAGGLHFNIHAGIPLELGADPAAASPDDLVAWHEGVRAEITERLDGLVESAIAGWAEAGTDGMTPEGRIKGIWPMGRHAAKLEGRALGVRAREKLAAERRLDTLGFSDLRLLHRDELLRPRRILALLGPTNSGKTHAGLANLAEAGTGAYLAPLRLLAMENQEALMQRGVACDLVTGEEVIEVDDATHVSSTIEMLDLGRRYDVVLIDEIQMLADVNRGWAWTRALLSVDAPLVIVAGSEDALPLINRIARITGDEVEVRRFERRNTLDVIDAPLALSDLQSGDAVIAFSRRDVLGWKEALDSRGMTSAVIYGALGPDVRRAEASRFRSGEAQVLIATDAIGMGLNLPIRRTVFTTATKYNGEERLRLTPSQIRQIAGRAGRFGDEGPGYAATMQGCDGRGDWLSIGLAKETRLPPDVRIAPTWTGVRRVLEDHPGESLVQALNRIVEAVRDHSTLSYTLDDDDRSLLRILGESHLTLQDQFRHLGLPLSMRMPENRRLLTAWLQSLARGVAPYVPNEAALMAGGATGDSTELQRLETTTMQCGAYAWLARKFPGQYTQGEEARDRRDAMSAQISRILAKGGLSRVCTSCGRRLKPLSQHRICDGCHGDRRNDW